MIEAIVAELLAVALKFLPDGHPSRAVLDEQRQILLERAAADAAFAARTGQDPGAE